LGPNAATCVTKGERLTTRKNSFLGSINNTKAPCNRDQSLPQKQEDERSPVWAASRERTRAARQKSGGADKRPAKNWGKGERIGRGKKKKGWGECLPSVEVKHL